MSNVQYSEDGYYWWDESSAEWRPVEGSPFAGQTTTIPEVTVEGDPNRAVDPNNGDEAEQIGYMDGSQAKQFDDSPFADAVKERYSKGWSAGRGDYQLGGGGHEEHDPGQLAGEYGAHIAVEVISHALELGPLGLFVFAATGGGDTQLPEAPVHLPVCHYAGHGGSGDTVLDAGAWHGQATLDYSSASSEAADHGSNWGHTDGVHVWMFRNREWSEV